MNERYWGLLIILVSGVASSVIFSRLVKDEKKKYVGIMVCWSVQFAIINLIPHKHQLIFKNIVWGLMIGLMVNLIVIANWANRVFRLGNIDK